MYIESIELKNYRNISDIKIKPHKKTSVLFGNNAQGKTNILESVYYCATGRSHRTNNDKELVSFDKNEAFIKLMIRDDYGRIDRIDINIRSNGRR